MIPGSSVHRRLYQFPARDRARWLEGGPMLSAMKRLLSFLGRWAAARSPDDDPDAYAWRPVPRKPQPKPRSSAVAVMEPDE